MNKSSQSDHTNDADRGQETVLDGLPGVVIELASDGTISWSNQSATEYCGVITGGSVYELLSEESSQELQRAISRVDQCGGRAAPFRLTARDSTDSAEAYLVQGARSVILLAPRAGELSCLPDLLGHLVSRLIDTGRANARQKRDGGSRSEQKSKSPSWLDDERRRLHSLVDQLPEGVVLVNDQSGEINLANARIVELWGLRGTPANINEFPLMYPDGSVVPDSNTPIGLVFASGLANGPDEFQIRTSVPEESPRHVEVSASPVLDDENQLIGAVMSVIDISEQKRLHDELATQVSLDPLTGVDNRRAFYQRLENLFDLQGFDGYAAVLYVDLDGFKSINDKYGHEAGDATLIEISKRLKRAVRDGDVVARIGGDEFALLLFPVPSRNHVEGVVRRLLEHLSAPLEVHEDSVLLAASVGIALVASREPVLPAEIMRRADLAMYQAKRSGTSHWRFEDELDVGLDGPRIGLADEIHNALDTEQFVLRYRPVVDLCNGRMNEVEIAMFWEHPVEGLLDDSELRRRAWRAGLLHAISERAAELAEHDRTLLIESLGRRKKLIMTRLHWIDYLRERRVVDQLLAIARDVDGSPIRVRMDLSGRLPPDDLDLIDKLQKIHDAGIGFALAGAGDVDGDLSLLNRVPIEAMTVSGSLVEESMFDKKSEALVRSMIRVADEFQIPIRASGINHRSTLVHVRTLGFSLASGSCFSEPLTAVDLLDFQLDHVFNMTDI